MASKIWQHAKMLRFDRVAFEESCAGPVLEFHQAWTPDEEHLLSFLDICPGWRHTAVLPPTYPQVALADLHSQILANRRFPFNPMGIVHVSNRVQVHRPISSTGGQSFGVRVALENWQPHRRGRVFDIRTELKDKEAVVWESVATALVMDKKSPGGTGSKAASETSEPSADCFHLPEDLGRRYARVAGDYNPIHQRAWMAKPFGFKRAIIHGMWTLGWAVHEPASRQTPGAMTFTGYFKRPVPLPSDIWRDISEGENDSLDIGVYRQGSPKVCLEVSLSISS